MNNLKGPLVYDFKQLFQIKLLNSIFIAITNKFDYYSITELKPSLNH